MIYLLLISPSKDSFSVLVSTLSKHDDVKTVFAESGESGLELASVTFFNLVVIDENLGDMTGLEFAHKLLSVNPVTNCAIVSPLSKKEFHEASEGLGVLTQLPPFPGTKEVEDMVQMLRKIIMLSSGTG